MNEGDTVVVIGFGSIALAVVALTKHRGARVVAIDPRQVRMKAATRLRAEMTISPADDPLAAMKKYTNDQGVDAGLLRSFPGISKQKDTPWYDGTHQRIQQPQGVSYAVYRCSPSACTCAGAVSCSYVQHVRCLHAGTRSAMAPRHALSPGRHADPRRCCTPRQLSFAARACRVGSRPND